MEKIKKTNENLNNVIEALQTENNNLQTKLTHPKSQNDNTFILPQTLTMIEDTSMVFITFLQCALRLCVLA